MLTGCDTTLDDIVGMTEVILVPVDADEGRDRRDISAEEEPSHRRDGADDVRVVEGEHGG